VVRNWGATEAERAASYPCQAYVGPGAELWLRAADVEAPAGLLFRWLCQLSVAPYSYDLLDNRGRRSPRRLTQGVERLTVGQPMMTIFRLGELRPGVGFTLVPTSGARRVFGDFAITYDAVDRGPGRSRLLASLAVDARTPAQRVRRRALAWGDVVMMRKQLHTLARLAERTTPSG
jgi:hypothetical protein